MHVKPCCVYHPQPQTSNLDKERGSVGVDVLEDPIRGDPGMSGDQCCGPTPFGWGRRCVGSSGSPRTPRWVAGPGPRSATPRGKLGEGGWGGSLATVDFDAAMTVSYVMNRMDAELTGDPRGGRLVDAAYASLS